MTKKIQCLNLAIISLLLISCSKEKTSNTPQPPPHPLSGTEVTFDNLSWEFYNSNSGTTWDEIYLVAPSRPDLFNVYNLLISQVFVKFDTSTTWLEVKSGNRYDPALPEQYLYNINMNARLMVNVLPLRHQLVGRRGDIRVRFR